MDSTVVSDADVHRRMCELEAELLEFQESSKDLEQALEEELQQLETENSRLAALALAKDARIATLGAQIVDLNAEVNLLTEELAESRRHHDEIMKSLKQQLVAIEILNEDMVSQDRVLEHKLRLAQVFNNELLEKLALVENDLELERDANVQLRLKLENMENANSASQIGDGVPPRNSSLIIEERKSESRESLINGKSNASLDTKNISMTRDSTFDGSFGDGTVLDINEMLASEPPTINMPRLSSLHVIQELYMKSDALRTKVGDLKAATTTETHDLPVIAKNTTEKNLSKHPSNETLASINLRRNEKSALRGVETAKRMETDTKKSRLREVMKSMFS